MAGVDADVLIVGGGPAGSSTACHLARKGLSVMVFDRQSFPRDKPCGEGIMPHGVRELDNLGVLGRISQEERGWFRGIRYCVGDAQADGDFPELSGGYRQGLGVRRIVLDKAIRDTALALGVTYVESTSVEALVEHEGLPVGLKTAERSYRGRFLVGADGNRSLTRKRLGLDVPPAKRRRYGVRAHFHYQDTSRVGEFVEVYVTPRGEIYTTPVGPHELLVALLLEQSEMERFGGRLEAAFEEFIFGDPRLAARFSGGTRISPVMAAGPLSSRSKRPITDGALLVGDAAGFIDPITGEGISIALFSARLAAEVIHSALQASDVRVHNLVRYEIERRREMRNFVLMTEGLLWLSHFPRICHWVIKRLSRQPQLFSTLLGINCGHNSFTDVRVTDVGQLLLGV